MSRLVGVLVLMSVCVSASGAVFTVTNLSDGPAPGPEGSLRKAVSDANGEGGPDVIEFQDGLGGTIVLTDGELSLTDTTASITINGPGAKVLTVSGNQASRVFYIATEVVVEISGLAIADGREVAPGAGICNLGTLALNGCVVKDNVLAYHKGIAGGLYSGWNSSLMVSKCLFIRNSSPHAPALTSESSGLAVLTNVTAIDNVSPGDIIRGSAIDCAGSGTLRLESCTVVGNTGSGIGVNSGSSTLEYRNTIVAGNSEGQIVYHTRAGTLRSLGHNISSDEWSNLSAVGDQPSTDPLLGPLADNGGPTMTLAPLPGSPAIDRGDPVNFPAFDQRGEPRPAAGGVCPQILRPDIGAVEAQRPDSDGGGVVDECDACPDTPPDSLVIANGCQWALVSAVSQRSHLNAGFFDIDLPLSGVAARESRSVDVGVPRVVLTFNGPVPPMTCNDVILTNAICKAVSVQGDTVVVALEGLSENQCSRVQVPLGGGDNDVDVIHHPGNVNSDGVVNVLDLQRIKNSLLAPVTAANASLDLDCNGVINVLDLQSAKNNLLTPFVGCSVVPAP